MLHDLRALVAAHRILAQIFEQRLAVNQAQRGVPERRGLRAQDAVIGDLAHQARVLALPQLPSLRILEDALRDQVLSVIVAVQGNFDSIGRFAHQTRMTDGTAVHPSILR